MVLVTSNKRQRLLCVNYIGHVTPAELNEARPDIQALLAELPPDLRLLADFSQLDLMDPECLTEMGATMELLDKHGIGLIVRVIPDARKDIGMNILSVFHYPHHPRIIACEKLAQALKKLAA